MTEVELVRYQPESGRAADMFAALMAAAAPSGISLRRTSSYQGDRPMLMFWGPGAPAREAVMRQHVAKGGHAVAFDLAYWNRDKKVRLSFDAAHPSAWVMKKDLPGDRLQQDRPRTGQAWRQTGPVMIAGIGDKARVQYGADTVDAWERDMLRTVRERWPGRTIVYRKKKVNSPVPEGVGVSAVDPIEAALTNTSLVITWHSNVAVDAIRMGIPVICRDGAASAVCPSTFGETDPQPLPADVRKTFLQNLAYYQWEPKESLACWKFVKETLQ